MILIGIDRQWALIEGILLLALVHVISIISHSCIVLGICFLYLHHDTLESHREILLYLFHYFPISLDNLG